MESFLARGERRRLASLLAAVATLLLLFFALAVSLPLIPLKLPVLPVDLDLLISDAATAAHWAGSRWHVLGHVHREGVHLDVTGSPAS
jgi:hypothetical protein